LYSKHKGNRQVSTRVIHIRTFCETSPRTSKSNKRFVPNRTYTHVRGGLQQMCISTAGKYTRALESSSYYINKETVYYLLRCRQRYKKKKKIDSLWQKVILAFRVSTASTLFARRNAHSHACASLYWVCTQK
jgi:hypothetical protein